MSPAHVLDPTYRTIRRHLTNGDWPPGFRLDTARLAAALGVSKSPVRDSLNRLSGERLVDFAPGDGFHVPRIEERQLQELLELNLLLLTAAIGCETYYPFAASELDEDARALRCFRTIAHASRNSELRRAIDGTSGRLARVLRHDATIIDGYAAELEALEIAIAEDHRDRLQILVRRCHEVRIRKTGTYVVLVRATGASDRSPL